MGAGPVSLVPRGAGAVVDPTRWAPNPRRSTPRWPSRHCTASGKCLCPSWSVPQVRRCAANRDLCGSCSGGDERHARVAECSARRPCPACERRPARRSVVADSPRAHAAPDLADRLVHDRPQRERHRDRRVPVVPARCDAMGHDGQDRAAGGALVAAARDHDPRRRTVGLERSPDLAIAEPVAMQTKTAAGGPTRLSAHDARTGPGALRRGPRCEPALDVERVMNDS